MSVADRVQVTLDGNENTQTISSPHTFAHNKEVSSATSLPDRPTISKIELRSAVAGLPDSFWKNKDEAVKAEEKDSPITTSRVTKISFNIDNISPPIANMFRRVITTEVPTMALDRVLIEENDSVIVDELLSHRLGLVPVAGPVSQMEYITASDQVSFQQLDPKRVLVFDLDVTGVENAPSTPVYSRDLKWVPLPGQEGWENGDEENRVFLVYPDILITKLGPRQRLKLRAIAIKGLGAVHTKWSPISSCYYEMKTEINVDSEKLTETTSQQLVDLCPKKVFEIEDGHLVAAHPDKCTMCRECLRKDAYHQIADAVHISKVKTSVRFHIESIGQIHASNIFRTALTLFSARCRELTQLLRQTEFTNSSRVNAS